MLLSSDVRLIRYDRSLYNTRGILMCGLMPLCHTFELPFNNNVQKLSCIPEGIYTVFKHNHPKFGDIFVFDGVPNRAGIFIHAGNTIKDTSGCILPGLDVDGYGVLKSRDAMKRLYQTLPLKFKLA